MSKTLSFLIFNGTVRKGQYTEHVTEFVSEVAKKRNNATFEVSDPRELNLGFDDEGQAASPKQLTKKVIAADGYIIVAPEYNHGYSGSLKYVLDLNLKQYIHKPVSFVGVSAGPYGGTRVIEALVNVVRELGLVSTFTDVNFSNVGREVENGKVLDPEKWEKRVDRMLDELLWMTKTLKHGREQIKSQYH